MNINEINKLLNSNYLSLDSFEKNATWEKDIKGKTINKNFANEFSHKIDWDYVSKYYNLNEDFIRFHHNRVNWKTISNRISLSENFIREFQDKVDWDAISSTHKLSENFIREFQDKVDLRVISSTHKLSENFIREFQDKVDWEGIVENQKLSEEFIEEFIEEIRSYVKLTSLLLRQKVSTKFVERYKNEIEWRVISYPYNNKEFFDSYADYLDWSYMSKKCTLSEEFIREHKNRVDWYEISRKQKLSESFIEEFQDKVYWEYIGEEFEYSLPFIRKHKDKLKRAILSTDNLGLIRELKDSISFTKINCENFTDNLLIEFQDNIEWINIIKTRKLSEELLDACSNSFNFKDWSWISDCQPLSENFIRKYQDKVHWGGISCHQTLSIEFMEEFSKNIWWGYIVKYQKLSNNLLDKYSKHPRGGSLLRAIPYQQNAVLMLLEETPEFQVKIDILLDTWLYKSKEFRKEQVVNLGLFECYKDYFVCEIPVDVNRHRPLDFHYQFNKGEVYEIFATQTSEVRTKGFVVGLFDNLSDYYRWCEEYLLLKEFTPLRVQVYYENVVHIVKWRSDDISVIRCNKLLVLD